MCRCALHATRPPWRSESAFAAGTQWMKAAAAPLSVPALQNVFSCCFAQVRCSLGTWKKKTVTHHSPPAWAKPLRERHRRMSPLKSKFIITPPILFSACFNPPCAFLSLSLSLFVSFVFPPPTLLKIHLTLYFRIGLKYAVFYFALKTGKWTKLG